MSVYFINLVEKLLYMPSIDYNAWSYYNLETMSQQQIVEESVHFQEKSSEDMKKETKTYGLGWRHVITMGVFAGYFLMYAMRVNLSVALVAMLNNTAVPKESSGSSAMINTSSPISICRRDQQNSTQIQKHDGPFEWSSQTQGILLGSFFYGYIFTQFAGGALSAKHGAKWVLGMGNLIPAILTLLSPLAAYLGIGALIAVRIVEGFGSGVMIPSSQALFSRWAPPFERSTLMAIAHSGMFIGTPVTFAISGFLVNSGFLGGWPSLFYVFGAATCAWFIFWTLFCSSDPESHKFISKDEKSFITQSLQATMSYGNKKPGLRDVPWKQALASKAVWSVYFSHFSYTWGLYVIVTCLPTYFKRVQGFDIGKNGMLSALPYLCQFTIHILSGKLADYLQCKFSITTVSTRKIFDGLGHILPAIFIVCVGYVGCNGILAVVIFTLAVGFTGLCAPGFYVNLLDIAPQFSSILFGISNTFATVPGIVGPYLTSYLTKENTVEGWRSVFFIIGLLYSISALIFTCFAQGTLQEWARPVKTNDESCCTQIDKSDKDISSM